MKRTLSFVGCGLLVVALGGVGCSSKNKTPATDGGLDGGATAGKAGSTAGKSGGGGSAGKSGAGGAGGAAATVTMAQCVSMTNTNSGNMTPAKCVDCLCKADPAKTAACDGPCWQLASCVGMKCGGNSSAPGCISDNALCATFVAAGAAKAMATPFAMCSAECVSTRPGDGGTHDAGN